MLSKRIFAALLALVLVVSVLPAPAFAEENEEPIIEDVELPAEEPEQAEPEVLPEPESSEEPEVPAEPQPAAPAEDVLTEEAEDTTSGICGEAVRWKLDEDGTLTISGSGAMKDFYDPDDSYNLSPWNNMTSSQDNVRKVIIEDGVTTIGNYAFKYCRNLTEVVMADSVVNIGRNAFDSCTGLKEITIGKGVTGINGFAFQNCTRLVKATIPNGVTTISGESFRGCTSLLSMVVPETVTSIGEGAFLGCSGMKSITIPAAVTKIGNYAFEGCVSMNALYISSLDAWCRITFGIAANPIFSSSNTNTIYLNNEPIVDMVIPSGVTEIPDNAFYRWNTIKTVVIPDTATLIGKCAFYECSSITDVSVSHNLTKVDDRAFENCFNLKGIVLPTGVTEVGVYAFYNCSDMLIAEFPDTVTSIGRFAFSNCSSLTEFRIPAGVTSIDDSTFRFCDSLTSITIPAGVFSIGYRAFESCAGLTSISIPDSVTSIGSYAFEKCINLLSVSIPSNPSLDMTYTFNQCSALETIIFTGNAPRTMADAFKGVTAEVHYPADDPTWKDWVGTQSGGKLTWIPYNGPAPEMSIFLRTDLTNNQSILLVCREVPVGASVKTNYTVFDTETGLPAAISGVGIEGSSVRINFNAPLKVGTYVLRFSNGVDAEDIVFDITLDLSVLRVIDRHNVIIQLSDAIIGCNVAENYSFHTLDNKVINITRAVSAFREMGGTELNVFKLTTDKELELGTTYVVETKAMFKGGKPCQGTIAYFTPTEFQVKTDTKVEVIALTNNQSIQIRLPRAVSGIDVPDYYVVTNRAGTVMPVGNVREIGTNTYEVNFTNPLKADHYTIASRDMSESLSGAFDITLDLSIVRTEAMGVIIQLNEPIYGCTTAKNYFVHKLGSDKEITALRATSVFAELGGEMPNVFRILLPEPLETGVTYIIETRAMALDPKWEHPCQGTIAYFTR